MVHRQSSQKFLFAAIRFLTNPIFSQQKIFPNYIQLVFPNKPWSKWELKMHRSRGKPKKCIVCNILTSTATGSFHECFFFFFSMIEVSVMSKQNLSRRDLYGVNVEVLQAGRRHRPVWVWNAETTGWQLTPLACCAKGAPFLHLPAASWHQD